MNTLKAKDLINIGIYSALYFVCMALATFLTGFVTGLILPGFSSLFVPGIVALVAGPVYMLLTDRVPRFGAITIMGLLMGLFFLVSGHFALSFIPYVVCGVLADVLQTIVGKARSNGLRYLSYLIFAFGSTGPVMPLWFMKNAYVASLTRKGKSQAYIDGVFAHISGPTLIICVSVTIIGALLGAWIGTMIVNRHFARTQAEA